MDDLIPFGGTFAKPWWNPISRNPFCLQCTSKGGVGGLRRRGTWERTRGRAGRGEGGVGVAFWCMRETVGERERERERGGEVGSFVWSEGDGGREPHRRDQ